MFSKIGLFILSFSVSSMVFAQETMGDSVSQSPAVEASASASSNPGWVMNIGKSNLEGKRLANGDGLTIELQKKFSSRYFAAISFAKYNTDYKSTVSVNDGSFYPIELPVAINIVTAGFEVHPIQVPLPKNSELFAATNLGIIQSDFKNSFSNTSQSSYYYGAGVGANYSNLAGIRLDLKLSSEITSVSTLSVIGYF